VDDFANPKASAVSAADVPWLLWSNGSTGQAALWQLNTDNTFHLGQAYGPFTGFTAMDVAVGNDGNARLLWDKADGTTILWTVSSSTLLETASGGVRAVHRLHGGGFRGRSGRFDAVGLDQQQRRPGIVAGQRG